MCLQPIYNLLKSHLRRCNGDHEVVGFSLMTFHNFPSAYDQKMKCSKEPCSFITIYKRMVADNALHDSRSLCKRRWIQFFSIKCLKWSGNCTFYHRHISNAMAAAIIIYRLLMYYQQVLKRYHWASLARVCPNFALALW